MSAIAPVSSQSSILDPQADVGLRGQLGGRLLLPEDDDYDEARRIPGTA